MKLPPILGKEFDFINKISKNLPCTGIGDDCAVIRISSKKHMLLSTDTFIENVHFDTGYFKADEIGARCCEAALSDIAAMGGTAKYALYSISARDTSIMEKISKGVALSLKRHGVRITGGDTTYSRNIVINFTVIGYSASPVLRSGAKAGDTVFISGYCGLSAAGLYAFKNHLTGFNTLKKKHLKPVARLDLAAKLTGIANAAIDISDGIISECYHIANASGVSVVIDNLPVHRELAKFCGENNLSTRDLVLNGGEDFELLYTVPKRHINKAPGFKIGHCVNNPGNRVYYSEADGLTLLKPRGFLHF